MAKILIVREADFANVEISVKYYAQHLLKTTGDEDLFIICYQRGMSIINQVREAGLHEENCEFIFCIQTYKTNQTTYFTGPDGKYANLAHVNDYFAGEQANLAERKIHALVVNDVYAPDGVLIKKCLFEGQQGSEYANQRNPLDTLYIPNNDFLKFRQGLKCIATGSPLDVFVSEALRRVGLISRFKEASKVTLTKDNMLKLLEKTHFEQLMLNCTMLKIPSSQSPESITALKHFIITVSNAKSDWEKNPQSWKTFTKTCRIALDAAKKSALQDFSEWNIFARSFIKTINWIVSLCSNEPVFKTPIYAKLSLFSQVIQCVNALETNNSLLI